MDSAAERLAPLLDRLTNYEKTRPRRVEWSLEGMRAVLGSPDPMPQVQPAVQIVGSKGKGTTAFYLDAAARAAGLRVGRFVSPHLETLLERIAVDGERVDVEQLERVLGEVLARAEARGVALTFFEALTLAAVRVFHEASVGLTIWEAGLGGRLDSTTALPVSVTVATTIEVEHEAVLGNTIAEVAAEKAGAFRPGGVVFTCAEGEALEVYAAQAARVSARLFRLGHDFAIERCVARDGGIDLSVRPVLGDAIPCSLEGAAEVEVPLAATACACLSWMESRPIPVARPELPGRFEVRERDGVTFVLDGAHTPGSSAAVASELRRQFPGRKFVLWFSTAADKRWQEGLSALLPVVDRAVVMPQSGTAGVDADVVVRWLRERGLAAERVGSVVEAHAGLVSGDDVLATGSFYLVGTVRTWLRTPN